MASQMGGIFYQVASPDVLIVDPASAPRSQDELRGEIEDFEDLQALDYKFCIAVEGASQESGLWVPRNQNETGLADADLQRFKNVAWNDCVVKKYLTGKEGDADMVGRSMLSIIQSLNLRWLSLHVMGLHPKVEAAERQVVMGCMEKALLPYDLDVGKIARALRRCEHFSTFFANAVGGQIVANTGRTPGLAKTMYGTDMDYAYKDKALYYFERSLQRGQAQLQQCLGEADSSDYVLRLTQLKIVKPDASVELTSIDDDKGKGPTQVLMDTGRSDRGWHDAVVRRIDDTVAKLDASSVRTLDGIEGKIAAVMVPIRESLMRDMERAIAESHTKMEGLVNRLADIEGVVKAVPTAVQTAVEQFTEDMDGRINNFTSSMERISAAIQRDLQSSGLAELNATALTFHRYFNEFAEALNRLIVDMGRQVPYMPAMPDRDDPVPMHIRPSRADKIADPPPQERYVPAPKRARYEPPADDKDVAGDDVYDTLSALV